jgi:thymidylate kinase
VRRAYRDLAPQFGWIVVDANGTVDEVAGRVRDALGPVLAG